MGAPLSRKGEALAKIARTRSVLIQEQPFFGVLCMGWGQPIELPECGTMATDGEHLFFNTETVLELPFPHLKTMVCHEAFHCALKHMLRLGGRDLEEANVAADLAINPELVRAGFELWKGALLDWNFADMGFEEIFAARAKQKRDQEQSQPQPGDQGDQGDQPQAGQGSQPQPGQDDTGKPSQGDSGQPGQDDAGQPSNASQGAGQPGQGSQDGGQGSQGGQPGQGAGQSGGQPGQGNGQGGQDAANDSAAAAAQPGQGAGQPGQGRTADDAGKLAKSKIAGQGGIMAPQAKPGQPGQADAGAIADRWEILTRQAIAVASKQAGNVPGMFERMLGEMNKSDFDARHVLADFIDSRVAIDYSFTRPNRRLLHTGFILPGATADGLEHLVWLVDSSGSIDQHMLDNAAAIIQEACDAGKVQRLTVVFADTHVRHVQEFERGEDIRAKLQARGGGGTRFDHALAWLAENCPDATAAIYLTDMECDHWGVEPEIPLLWAIHGDSRDFNRLAGKAPFGRVEYVGRLE